MTNTMDIQEEYIITELKKFNITDTAIDELKTHLSLKINGIEDKDGYKAVKSARMTVKGFRVDIEKRRKELNANALKFQRAINSEAKRITDILEPIENHLSHEEDAFEAEKEKLKKQKENEALETQAANIKKIIDIGYKLEGTLFSCDYCEIKFSLEGLKILEVYDSISLANDFYIKHQNSEKIRLDQIAAEEKKEKDKNAELQRIASEEKQKSDKIVAELKIENQRLEQIKKENEEKLLRLRNVSMEVSKPQEEKNYSVSIPFRTDPFHSEIMEPESISITCDRSELLNKSLSEKFIILLDFVENISLEKVPTEYLSTPNQTTFYEGFSAAVKEISIKAKEVLKEIDC